MWTDEKSFYVLKSAFSKSWLEMQSSLPGWCFSSLKDCLVQPGSFHFNFSWDLWIFEATSKWGDCCLQVSTSWQTEGQDRGVEERVPICIPPPPPLVSADPGSNPADANGWAVLRVIVDSEGTVSNTLHQTKCLKATEELFYLSPHLAICGPSN